MGCLSNRLVAGWVERGRLCHSSGQQNHDVRLYVCVVVSVSVLELLHPYFVYFIYCFHLKTCHLHLPSHRSPGLGTGWGARPNVTGNKVGLMTTVVGAMATLEALTNRMRLKFFFFFLHALHIYLINLRGHNNHLSCSPTLLLDI